MVSLEPFCTSTWLLFLHLDLDDTCFCEQEYEQFFPCIASDLAQVSQVN